MRIFSPNEFLGEKEKGTPANEPVEGDINISGIPKNQKLTAFAKNPEARIIPKIIFSGKYDILVPVKNMKHDCLFGLALYLLGNQLIVPLAVSSKR